MFDIPAASLLPMALVELVEVADAVFVLDTLVDFVVVAGVVVVVVVLLAVVVQPAPNGVSWRGGSSTASFCLFSVLLC